MIELSDVSYMILFGALILLCLVACLMAFNSVCREIKRAVVKRVARELTAVGHGRAAEWLTEKYEVEK